MFQAGVLFKVEIMGQKLLISYTKSHDVLGHLEEFHFLL